MLMLSVSLTAQLTTEEAIPHRSEKTLSGQYISTFPVDDVAYLSNYISSHPGVEVLSFTDGVAKIFSDTDPRLSLFSYFLQNLTPQPTTKTRSKFTSNLQSHLSKSSSKSNHELVITLHRASDLDIIVDHLKQAGLAQVSGSFAKTLDIIVSPDQLGQIASLAEVAVIDIIDESVQPLNYEARILQHTSVLYADASVGGYGLTGSGVTIGIGDGGELGKHIDFGNRVVNQADGTYSSFGAHGDHVAGIVGASGALNPRHRGIAPGAQIITQKTTQILAHAEDYHDAYGMTLTNNSYGVSFNCETNGTYNYNSVNLDYISRMNPKMLHVFAAGNNGTRSCEGYPDGFNTILRNYQSAKNVITVGAVSENREIASLSARGPVADGRIKPEIVTNGMNIVSTGNDLNYFSNNGTSMAAPALTATLALLSEQYEKMYNESPDGALLKAIACNSADDLGNMGPDYTYGFGMVNARKAIETIVEERHASGLVENGNNSIHLIEVPNGVQEVKVMLYWSDKESTHQAAKTLVNDLDIRVTDAAQVTHLPWVLNIDPAHVATPATKGIDDLNNIEQVSIQNPSAGTLRVTIDGGKVPFDVQNYVLVYEFITPDVTLTYPNGSEIFTPDEYELISWDAASDNDTPFKLSYSNNNGGSWTTLMNNIPAHERSYAWNVAGDITDQAIIKIEKVDGSSSDQSAPFGVKHAIASFEVEPICEGMVAMNWIYPDEEQQPTSLLMINDKDGDEINMSSDGSYIHEQPLSIGEPYWFAADHVDQGGFGTTRTLAQMVIPSNDLTCPWTDDIKLTAEPVLFTGRAQTSLSTITVQVPVQMKNIGSNALDQPELFYYLNGDQSAVVPQILGSGESYSINVIETLRNLPIGTTTVDFYTPSDRTDNNDLRDIMTIRMLANEPVQMPYALDLESVSFAAYVQDQVGISDIERLDYQHAGNGQLEVNNIDGAKALILSSTVQAENQYTMTFNLNGMTSDEPLFLQMDYQLSGQGATSLEVRGSDQDEWILLSDMIGANEWTTTDSLAISEILSQAGQSYSTSTQVRLSQNGEGTFVMKNLQITGPQEAVAMVDYENQLEINNVDGQYEMSWFNNLEGSSYQYEIQYANDSVSLVNDIYQIWSTVNGKGENAQGWTYESLLEDLQPGQVYFIRVQTTKENQETHYTNIVRIETEPGEIDMPTAEKFNFILQNLVAADDIHYRLQLPSRFQVTSRLLSSSGAVVYQETGTYDGGTSSLNVPRSAITQSGIYFLELSTAAERLTKRVVVQ